MSNRTNPCNKETVKQKVADANPLRPVFSLSVA